MKNTDLHLKIELNSRTFQGLLKYFPTAFKDWKLMKNTVLHLKLSKIQGLFKDFLHFFTVLTDWKLMKNTDLHVKTQVSYR